jgi:hypothetical protein
MPVLTFQAVPVDKMRDYQMYEAYYKEHNQQGMAAATEPEGPLHVIYSKEDVGTSATLQQPQGEFADVEAMFKSRYQGMARVILTIVRQSGGRLDQYQRLIYPNGQLGSSLFELVRYTIIPPRSRKAQPVDYSQFARLLRDQNAPRYILDKISPGVAVELGSTSSSDVDKYWLRYV